MHASAMSPSTPAKGINGQLARPPARLELRLLRDLLHQLQCERLRRVARAPHTQAVRYFLPVLERDCVLGDLAGVVQGGRQRVGWVAGRQIAAGSSPAMRQRRQHGIHMAFTQLGCRRPGPALTSVTRTPVRTSTPTRLKLSIACCCILQRAPVAARPRDRGMSSMWAAAGCRHAAP